MQVLKEMVQAIGSKLETGEAQVQACSKRNYIWVISQKLNKIQQFAQKYKHVGWRQKDVSTKVGTTNAPTKGKANWTPVEQAAWVWRPIRSLEVQLAGASENLELDQKLKEKLKHLKTQKLQDLMMLKHTREGLIDCMRKGWAKTDLSRKEIPDPESQFKLKSCLKQRNNWSTEAGEWQTARTTQETRAGYRCSHCMLQSAMEQHAFAVSIRT